MRRTFLALAALCASACSDDGGGYPPCSSSCAAPMNACDPASGRCVPTNCSQTGCSGAGFHCDDFYDYCTTAPHCLGDGNCPAGWACFEADNTCRPLGADGCRAWADCPPGLVCDLTAHVCRDEAPCQAVGTGCPEGMACDPGGICRAVPPGGCFFDLQCPGTGVVLCVHDDLDPATHGWCSGCTASGIVCGGTLHACDPVRNECKGCLSDADCSAPFVCGRGGCVECYEDADCADPEKPVCFYDVCRECRVTADCASKPGTTCDTHGACRGAATYECSSATDCPADRPRCDTAAHLCQECVADGDCGDAGLRCTGSWCEPIPAGEKCSAPVPLALAPDHTLLVADLDRYTFECESYCSAPANDAFWSFTLEAPATLEILTADSNYPPSSVEVRTDGCAQAIASKARPVVGSPFVTPPLAAGTKYVLRVEGDGAQNLRHYTLLIRRAPVP